MANSPTRSQFIFIQPEATAGTIPNSTGTATLAAGDAIRFNSFSATPNQSMLRPKYKTGSQSQSVGVPGLYTGTATLEVPLIGSGTAGTANDYDVLLAAAFGKAGTVVASTSITFNPEDSGAAAVPTFVIWDFRDPAGMRQVVYRGCQVLSLTVNGNQDEPTITFNISFLDSLTSDEFSGASSTRKGGLITFPTRPATPTYIASTPATGLSGSFSLDGQTDYTIYSYTATYDFGRSRNTKALFTGGLAGPIEMATRKFSFSAEIEDSTDSDLLTTTQKYRSGGTMTVTPTFGATAGNIWSFPLYNVQLTAVTPTESEANWGLRVEGEANETSAGSKDEGKIVLT